MTATDGMVRLDGGRFLMGSEDALAYPDDGEGPVRAVKLDPFWIDAMAVTNERFATFVAATGHVTDAERFGWSFVFAGLLPDDFPATRGVAAAPWWRQVEGADWRHPEGPGSSVDGRADHPVVHVSWTDASAFAGWEGKRLATEAEWEYAARGGLEQRAFPWGDEREPEGEHRMNVWQGRFPVDNTLADGWLGTAPVDAFGPNGYGLFNTTGNVWEWCADWFSPSPARRGTTSNPVGPPSGTSRVMRGGSYLCHDSYCRRYRVAARSGNTPDSSTGNLGLRCAREPEHPEGDVHPAWVKRPREPDRIIGLTAHEEAPMATLTVWRFDTASGAEEAIHVLERLQKELLINVHDAALVSWPEGKKKPKTRQLNNLAGAGALGGAFWGLLFGLLFFIPLLGMAVGAAVGALSGSLVDVGIDDRFIDEVRQKVTPGTSALFLMTSDAVIDKVKDAWDGTHAELVHTNLSNDEEAKLREVFQED